MSETPDNPWREFVENVISGDDYFRASEYHELLNYIDGLIVSLAAVTRERDEHARWREDLAYKLDRAEKERDALRAEVARLRGVIPSLIVVQRMPNAEHVADAHNAAVRVLRAALTTAEVTK